MGYSETPALTDAEYLKKELVRLNDVIEAQQDRLDRYVEAINSIGANIQWITENVQGIFQMFSNPAFMSQMMGNLTGMISGTANPEGNGNG